MAVRVAVRVRPWLPEDGDADQSMPSIEFDADEKSLTIANSRHFTLDKCFTGKALQMDIYEFISPLVNEFLNGKNCSVLAYGQTGSGKTYTMGSDYSGTCANVTEDSGIIPRILLSLFEYAKKESDEISFKVSFLEILNDTVYDVLTQPKTITQVQNRGNEIQLTNLTEVEVETFSEAVLQLTKGVKARVQARTDLNINSSRSHAFFIVKMHRETENSFFDSTLHMVDLAGSENSKKANTTGDRFVEGVSINKSLLFLGEVITKLSTRAPHIPYRNNVLTRILKETLNGSSVMRMITCVNPNVNSIPETINTLRYACSARNLPHHTLLKVGKENKFQAQLQEVLPTPVKGQFYPLSETPNNKARSLDSVISSVGKDFGLPKCTSTAIRPPPPPIFHISPEERRFSTREQLDDFLSPLASKISNLLEQRMSSRASMRPSALYEETDVFDTFAPRQSFDADHESLSRWISPIVTKVYKRVDQSIALKFKELEQKLCESKVTNSSGSRRSSWRQTALTDVTNKILIPASVQEINLDSTGLKYTSPIAIANGNKGVRTSPVKTRRRTMLMAIGTENEFTTPKEAKKSEKPGGVETIVRARRQTAIFLSTPQDSNHASPKARKRRTTMSIGVRTSPVKTRRQTMLIAFDDVFSQPNVSEISDELDGRRGTQPNAQSYCPLPLKSKNLTMMAVDNIFMSPPASEDEGELTLHTAKETAMKRKKQPSVGGQGRKRTRTQTEPGNIGKSTTASNLKRQSRQGGKTTSKPRHPANVPPTAPGRNAFQQHKESILRLLNTGTIRQLESLPAIGPKSAYMLHTYRTLHGGFETIEEVKHVGLPQNIYNRFVTGNHLK